MMTKQVYVYRNGRVVEIPPEELRANKRTDPRIRVSRRSEDWDAYRREIGPDYD